MCFRGTYKFIGCIWKNKSRLGQKLITLILNKMSNCCTLTGLTTYSVNYTGYASDSSGSNFSLGTPLSSSKYIAFISVLSTAGTPVAADFAGLWIELYGSLALVEVAAVDVTTSTTPTIISTFNTPLRFWKVGDVVNLSYSFFTLFLSANGKLADVLFLGVSLGITFDLSTAPADAGILKVTLTKTSATAADFEYELMYTDSTGAMVGTPAAYFGSVSGLANTDSVTSSISIEGTCANAGETLERKYSSALLTKS